MYIHAVCTGVRGCVCMYKYIDVYVYIHILYIRTWYLPIYIHTLQPEICAAPNPIYTLKFAPYIKYLKCTCNIPQIHLKYTQRPKICASHRWTPHICRAYAFCYYFHCKFRWHTPAPGDFIVNIWYFHDHVYKSIYWPFIQAAAFFSWQYMNNVQYSTFNIFSTLLCCIFTTV